jgi:DNA-binding NtrC family response regulator
MIVEDDRELLSRMQRVLAEAGFQCTPCRCIADALAAFEVLRVTEGPKVIVLDCRVPTWREDIDRADALDARRSKLWERLFPLDGEKLASDEVSGLRQALNDLDHEAECLIRKDGQKFLETVKDQLGGFGVIITTAASPINGFGVPAGVGILRVLEKPYALHLLIRAVRECCDYLGGGAS